MSECRSWALALFVCGALACTDTPRRNSPVDGLGDDEDQNVAGASGSGGGASGAGGVGGTGGMGETGGSGGGASGEGGEGGGEGGGDGGDPGSTCGNGELEGSEQCDDGNLTSLDGCGASCMIGLGWVCPDPGESCATVCGDGHEAGEEVCDDGNDDDDDYCSDGCTTVGECGDDVHQPSAGEQCDDGNTVSELCDYGEETCEICTVDCQLFTRLGTFCGDSVITEDEGEACDDGNAVTEHCAYGAMSCTVCNDDCVEAAGATHECGDGQIDQPDEQCDDDNAVTEACAYGLASCTVCTATCQNSPGATSYCGDSMIDGSNGEDCDDGNAVAEACAYGETSCTVCASACITVAGETRYCGDQQIDQADGEECDDGDEDPLDGCDACAVVAIPECGDGVIEEAVGEDCDDGNDESLDGCNAACQREAGWNCPTVAEACHEICGDGLRVGDEPCDDDNEIDDDYCSNDCTTRRFCGDGDVQTSAGEACDDSNVVTERCGYGETSCTVCNASCDEASGATSYCGDAVVDEVSGEECDDGAASETCRADCKLQRYCIIEASLIGEYQLTSTLAMLGDGTFPQSGGTIRMRLPDDGTGVPGAHASSLNRAGVLYYNMPVAFQKEIPVLPMTITTAVTSTAGTPGNLCPLNRGTLAGTHVTWLACPYRPGDGTSGHCTTDWTPDHQNAPEITPTAGCLPTSASGNINCNGTPEACSLGALQMGDNPVSDSWSQPQNTVQFDAAFTSSVMNGLGGPTDCPASDPSRPTAASYTNKLETPERVSSRGWISTAGTGTSLTCNLLPADCDQ
jgi:cysteine-rich repeat protein